MTDREETADFVVIGAGSTGAIVAARLAEAGFDTILAEAGPRDLNPWIHVPLGFGKAFLNPRLTWPYEVEGGPGVNDRRIFQPRGRVLGGTGAVNGMTYMRGAPQVYDSWGPGWTHADLLPFFRKAEANSMGASLAHGGDGPIHVSSLPDHPLMEVFARAATAQGAPRRTDFNGDGQLGVGPFQFTLHRGRRSNSATGYLRPRPAKLRVLTHCQAERLEIRAHKVTGVLCRRHGAALRLQARREVILSAGTFATPQLLQLSGIGPGALLQGLGLGTVLDRPEVGQNVQDHFETRVICRTSLRPTVNETYANPLRRMLMGMDYLVRRKGFMAGPGTLGGGFFRLAEGEGLPDLQLNLGIWTTSASGPGSGAPLLDAFPAYRMTLVDLAPDARATVTITSPDATTLPRIRADFLQSERDRHAMVAAMRLGRSLAATAPLSDVTLAETVPGRDAATDADLLDYCRREGRPNFHAVGSCRMGEDAGAVVDSRLRLRGLDGLRIADASIMPRIPNANTNAACMAIGEKAAAMIAAEARV